jgi:hypothetical protein
MTKGKIGKTEIKLLNNGSWRCKDPERLELVQHLSKDYDSQDHGYQPHKQWHRMTWISEKLGSKLTHFDPIDYSNIHDGALFSAA